MIEKLNKKYDPLLFAIISAILIFLSQYSLIFSLSMPILMAIKLGIYDKKEKYIYLFLSGLFSSILDLRLTLTILVPSLIYALIIVYLIRINLWDKKSLFILTSLTSIFILALLGYIYKEGLIDFKPIISEFSKAFESEGLKLNEDVIINALKTIPAMCVIMNLIYSFISLKLVRNYLNYKDERIRDLKSINEFRLEIKDIIILFVIFLLISAYAHFLGIDFETIKLNSLSVIMSLLQINGLLLIDYFFAKRSKLTRIINWFLIFLVFAILSDFFAVIGLIDIGFNIRKKVRRYER